MEIVLPEGGRGDITSDLQADLRARYDEHQIEALADATYAYAIERVIPDEDVLALYAAHEEEMWALDIALSDAEDVSIFKYLDRCYAGDLSQVRRVVAGVAIVETARRTALANEIARHVHGFREVSYV